MSNQVFASPDNRYDNINSGTVYYTLASSQSIPDDATTKVINYTLERDDGIGSDVSLAAGVFTFKKAGVYCIQASGIFATNIAGSRRGSLLYTPDGGAGAARRIGNVEVPSKAAGTDVVGIESVAMIKVQINDNFQWDVLQNRGGVLDLVGNAADPRSNLVITRIA